MEFIINPKTFSEYVTLAADIATKGVIKDHLYAGMINISAYPKIVEIEAYGGSASVTVKVGRPEGYEYGGMGNACVRAEELRNALKSVPPSEDLIVCIKDGKLKLSPVSDIYDYIKMTIYPICVQHPESPEKYDQEVTVSREYFVKGLQQIIYAPATDEELFSYMCVLFESNSNMLKFSAGSGGRFAVVEYVNNNKFISSGDTMVLFPKTNVPNIIRVLKKSASSTLVIKISPGDSTENIPEQYVLEADNITLRIYGMEYFTIYPDLNKTTGYTYTYQIHTKMQDWKYVAESIIASKHSLEENVHNVKVMADLLHGHFDIQANTLMNMNKKVPFESDKCVFDTAKEKSYIPWFCCNAYYLIEIVKKNKKKKKVIFNFEDQAKLDETPDGQPKRMKPVLLRFPDEVDKNGVTEKLSVFFAVSTKWDDKYLSLEQESIQERYEILDL